MTTVDDTARGEIVPRGLLIIVGLAATTIAIAGIRGLAGIIAPTFLALVLTILVHPVRGWVERKGWPSWVGTLLAMLVVYSVLLALTLSLVLATARFALLLPDYEDEFTTLLGDIRGGLANLGVGEQQTRDLVSSFDLGRLTGFVTGLLTSLLNVLSDLLFVVTLLFFMAIDGSWFPKRLAQVRATRPQVADAFDSFARGTITYLIVSTIFGLIVAVIDTAVLWALGVPAPLLWGLLAFITNYIPNIGFVIGLIPPAVLALLEGGPSLMLWVILAYCVINVVIQSVIQPKVVGDAVGLSATITFLSLVFWAWAIGPLGALLAVPLSLLAKALLVDVDPAAVWVRPLIAGPAGPSGRWSGRRREPDDTHSADAPSDEERAADVPDDTRARPAAAAEETP